MTTGGKSMKKDKDLIYSMTVKDAEARAKAHERDASWDLWEDVCQKKDAR